MNMQGNRNFEENTTAEVRTGNSVSNESRFEILVESRDQDNGIVEIEDVIMEDNGIDDHTMVI